MRTGIIRHLAGPHAADHVDLDTLWRHVAHLASQRLASQRPRHRERGARGSRHAESTPCEAQCEAQLDSLCMGPDGNGNCSHQGLRSIIHGSCRRKLCEGCYTSCMHPQHPFAAREKPGAAAKSCL